tara:strand:- start:252 stop:416 length:165 start_codon:yes stop_codon:yes gene_type:complete
MCIETGSGRMRDHIEDESTRRGSRSGGMIIDRGYDYGEQRLGPKPKRTGHQLEL